MAETPESARASTGGEAAVTRAIGLGERGGFTPDEVSFRLFVESVEDYAIFMLDPEGRIMTWNAGAARIKGYQAEEIIGKHFSVFYPEEDVARGKPAEQLRRAAAEGRVEDEGLRVRRDGSTFWANVVLTALRDESGRLRGFGKVTRDMSERRRIEDEERRSRLAAEAANRELEAFCYSVSHDLRAPLRAIDGFSLALLEDHADELDAEGREHLDRVRANAQRMAQLIDDLLRLSRTTRAELRREDVDLSAMAREVAAGLRRSAPERRSKISIQEGVHVQADAHLLRLALENLLGNAWKFTRTRPVAEIELGAEDRGGEVSCFVRDNGVGFDMAHAGRLFGAFQRLHRTSEFPGTGIGLATVQRIVHRHGGRIWADAAVDRGATFHFTLPPGSTRDR